MILTMMKWNDKYSIGHERIDHEHQVFLDLIRTVPRGSENNAPKARVLRLLEEVKKYAEFHFISEENIMLDVAYPDYDAHKIQHQKLLTDLDMRLHQYNVGDINLSIVLDFLFMWFTNHTSHSDKKLAIYINYNDPSKVY